MVELAVALPFLCAILVITIDYARLFYALATITDCARDGALYFANHPNDTAANIRAAALADAEDLIKPDRPAPTVATKKTGPDANGDWIVEVTVTYPFTTLAHFPGIPSSTTLSRKVVMMVTP